MPAGRELSHTVAEPADIPGLCNEDLMGENRILADCPEEAAVLREAVLASCHGNGKVEAEAVNLYHLRPVAEESMMSLRAAGLSALKLFPQPVKFE